MNGEVENTVVSGRRLIVLAAVSFALLSTF